MFCEIFTLYKHVLAIWNKKKTILCHYGILKNSNLLPNCQGFFWSPWNLGTKLSGQQVEPETKGNRFESG